MSLLPRIRKSKFFLLLPIIVIFLSVFVGVILVQQKQELRERAASSIPAFPGAEGFGAQSIGGRGGKVFEVTNLKNSGSGSLRACIEASGPRTCVFRTGGTIELTSKLIINNPYITIAGQTAPGGGIALKRSAGTSESFFTVGRGSHDVIIRYIRVRPGTVGGQPDGIEVYGNNTIVDHSSVSWAVDENTTTWYDVQNVTYQWSIISEGLHCSTHPKGCHSMGMILGDQGAGNISIHHNLFAHNDERSPRIKTSGTVDVVNNVIYNPGISGSWGPSHISGDYSRIPVNYVANYYKTGPDSDQPNYYISASGTVDIYVKGNITPKRPSDNLDEIQGVVQSSQWVVSTRHSAPSVTTTSAFDAYDQVLAQAGATLPVRDSVDQRIVNDVKNGTGRIIDDPSEVGGWPSLASGTPPTDSDHDGMADNWERSQFGSLGRNGTGDANSNGYTDLEEYLNFLAGAVPPPPPPTTSTPTPTKGPTATPTPTRKPTPTPTPKGPTPTPPSIPRNSFRGQYYNNKDFTSLIHTRIDPAIDFDWKSGSPASGIGVDSFSVRWEGDWDFAQTGTYRFTAETDDGIRVFVDGQKIIDSWKRQSPTVYTADIQISSGTHRIKVDYYEEVGGAVARLSWALTASTLPGDIDADGDVDIFDYNTLVSNFGATNCGNQADIDGDCKVDIFDYNLLVGNFGK